MANKLNKIKVKGTIYSLEDKEAREELANKQDTLTAGSNISIVNNVISATSGSGSSEVKLATLDSSKWDSGSNFYSQSITLDGITSDTTCIIDIVIQNYSDLTTLNKEWAKVYKAEVGENTITFYSIEKITSNLTISVMTSSLSYMTTSLSKTWNNSSVPYTQSITLSGITEDSTPYIDVIVEDPTKAVQLKDAWSHVYNATTSSNTITFYSSEKLDIAIPISIATN